jgi:hypothetical protein
MPKRTQRQKPKQRPPTEATTLTLVLFGVHHKKRKEKGGCWHPLRMPYPSIPKGLPEHIPDQVLELGPWHQLHQQVSNVCFTTLPGHTNKSSSLGFTSTVIHNCIMMFLQNGFRRSHILHDRLIIAKDRHRAIEGYPHHAQLVLQALNHIDRSLHGAVFGTKCRSLHSVLSLRIPKHRGLIDITQHTSM